MPVWEIVVVNTGYAGVLLGGVLLLLVAIWWSAASDGIRLPRERWPAAVRAAAVAGWGLFIGGLVVQVVGYFVQVGVARW